MWVNLTGSGENAHSETAKNRIGSGFNAGGWSDEASEVIVVVILMGLFFLAMAIISRGQRDKMMVAGIYWAVVIGVSIAGFLFVTSWARDAFP